MLVHDTVGKRIKFYRNQRDLSLTDLAELAGVHRNYLSLVERDETQMTIPRLRDVAKALHVSCAHLLGEVGLLDEFPGQKGMTHAG